MKKTLYQFLFFAFAFLLTALPAFAQTGSIKGSIIDSTANEALIGATIQIENTSIGASADVEGNYQIVGIKEGTYTIVCTMMGYQTLKITGIQVQAGKTIILNVNMRSDANTLTEVVLTTQKETMGELAVISEIKGAQQVAVGMSGEQISKTQDRDAAQVVKRIAGVSIFDDRFIMIRGLSQRYNTVMLNDAIAPSSEVDIRAFSFDMLPSSAIDRILIFKSGAGELPAEFAGGVVKVYTKLAPTENFTSVGFSTGFRAGTTFNNLPTYKGSNTDFLGFDNKVRTLPNDVPSTATVKRLFNQGGYVATATIGREFNNTWNINAQQARPDLRLNYTMGRRFAVGSVEVGMLHALAYSNTFQRLNNAKVIRYGTTNVETGETTKDVDFTDEIGTNSVRLSAISNWSLIFNRYNKIEFRNFFNQMGTTEALQREGKNYNNDTDIRYNSLRYEQRSIYSSQLSGKHNLSEKTMFRWLGGMSYTNRNEPDFRRYSLTKDSNSDQPFKINLPANPNASEASRFFSRLDEQVFTGSINLEQLLDNKSEAENGAKFKTGFYVERKARLFTSRIFGYKTAPQGTLGDLATKDAEILFAPENVNGTTRLAFEENTNNETDAYKAKNALMATYASVFYPISNKFSISVGARVEFNDQQLLTKKTNTYTNKVGGKAIVSFLPSLNLTYNLNDKMLMRWAYASTVNRPEFRELAPFAYYEPNLDAVQKGNPNLGIARIENVDMRWEYYPTPNEIISFGAFYKYFRNPIENQLLATNGQYTYSFIQVENAQNYGLETELRKSLANSTNAYLKNLTFVFNASYIISNVTNPDKVLLGDGTSLSTAGTLPAKRMMFGQSPYLINGGVFYNDETSKVQVSVLYNVFGRRLFAVGNISDSPSQYEMPRHSLDLTITKGFKNGLEVRFGAQELLNPAFKVVEDSIDNGKGKLNGAEKNNVVFSSRRGQYLNLGVSYKF